MSRSEILANAFGLGGSVNTVDVDADEDVYSSQQEDDEAIEGDGEGPVFQCNLESAETLNTLISAVLMDRKEQIAAFWTISKQGLKISVEKHQVLQARVYLKAAAFQEFNLKTDSLQFAVSLGVLVDCLSVFGDVDSNRSVHLALVVNSPDEPLSLMLEEHGVITHCEISTIAVPQPSDFSFRSHQVANRVTLKASFLKELFSDFDLKGAQCVEFTISPNHPHLSFMIVGDACSVQICLPRDSGTDAYSVFDCKEEKTFSYNLNLFKSCQKAISRADQVNIRMNQIGMLSMQFVIRPQNQPNTQNWIDFLLCPESSGEDESKNDNE